MDSDLFADPIELTIHESGTHRISDFIVFRAGGATITIQKDDFYAVEVLWFKSDLSSNESVFKKIDTEAYWDIIASLFRVSECILKI